jgi:hypothetical protein
MILIIILGILIFCASVILIKLVVVRIKNMQMPTKPIQLIKPQSSTGSPGSTPGSTPGATLLPTNNPNNPDTPDPPGSDETADAYKNAALFLGNLIKTMVTTPGLYEFIGFNVGIKIVIRTCVFLVRIGLVQTMRFAAIKALSFLESAVLKMAEVFGLKTLEKFGIFLSETVIKQLAKTSVLYTVKEASEKAAEDLGAEAAEALVKSIVGKALEESVDAFLGPIGLALDVLQAAGLLLDLWDPAKYNDMQENSVLNDTRIKCYKALMDGLSAINPPIQQRPLKGPLNILYKNASITDPDSKDPNSPINIITTCYTNAIYNIMNSPVFIDSLILSLQTDQTFIYSDTQMQQFMSDNINPEIILRYCSEIECEKYGGDLVRLSGECSFNHDSCHKSNINYPAKPPEGEFYVEWDQDRGECSMALTTIKDICESKNVGSDNQKGGGGSDYDPETGLCAITQYYCMNRYGENFISPEDNTSGYYPDCKLTGFQSFWEAVFGKTIVRAFTRTFDNATSPN